MSKPSTHLRFLLSLGNTKIVVLNNDEDLQVYSNQAGKARAKHTIATERVTDALVK